MKRLTLFCGHYGSGKTNLAVNYALWLKQQTEKRVMIADLDIVNPYFRSKDSAAWLGREGVELIACPYANTNVDLPSLPSEMYALVQDKTLCGVLDIGGDDRGALALGRLTPSILAEGDYDNFCVVNFYRPLTRTAEEVAAVMQEIVAASGLPFTAIVNNSNLGEETTAETVLQTQSEAEKLSALVGLPIAMTAARKDLAVPNSFPLTLQDKYW